MKGYYKDKFVFLSGPINSSVTIANPIKLEGISLNIPIFLGECKETFEGEN